MAKNTSATTSADTAQETPETAVPETKVSIPVGMPRDVLPVLHEMADTQLMLADMPKQADIVRQTAENFFNDPSRVAAYLMLARDIILSGKQDDKAICGLETIAQCEAAIAEYRATDNAEQQTLLKDRVRLLFAGVAPWVGTAGKTVKDSATGETRKRSLEEVATVRMARRVATLAPRLTPSHLTSEQRSQVDAFRANAAAKKLENARSIPSARRVVDAVQQPAGIPANN